MARFMRAIHPAHVNAPAAPPLVMARLLTGPPIRRVSMRRENPENNLRDEKRIHRFPHIAPRLSSFSQADANRRLTMATTLHSTLESYFAATNRHDVDGMIAAFADDAVVKDEGREHQGTSAIQEWVKETIRKYDFKAEPTAVTRANDQTVVGVTVSGTFPGSPIALTYRFRLDGRKIARLDIG